MRLAMLLAMFLGVVTTLSAIVPAAVPSLAQLETTKPADELQQTQKVDGLDETITSRQDRPLIQFAICLDTSGSMQGLIDAARQKLWTITNELALAVPAPRLEVALLTFGNDGHNPERGWVATHLDFTEDLDTVSQLLFSFVTNGGTELVGRVLKVANDELSWDDSSATLRLLFVAGNESADQDGVVPFRDAARTLITRDISVSAIYCGAAEDAIAPGWREVSLCGDGHFATIDHNHGTITIETPYDKELIHLGEKLNTTYIPYGEAGRWGARNQALQDNNASLLNCDAAASRANCKATANYFCSWDLVDLLREKQIEVTKIVITDLPKDFQSMTITEIVTHANSLQSTRSAIQAQIKELNTKRQAFLNAEMARRAITEENSFDAAIRTAIRTRARAKGFRFPDPKPGAAEAQVKADASSKTEVTPDESTSPETAAQSDAPVNAADAAQQSQSVMQQLKINGTIPGVQDSKGGYPYLSDFDFSC